MGSSGFLLKNWWRPTLPRSEEADARLGQLRLEHFLWFTGGKSNAIVIVLCPEMLHTPDMKTPFRLSRLVG